MLKDFEKACKITDNVFSCVLSFISTGQTEKEIAGFIKEQIKKRGFSPSFKVIVASGPRAALPHGPASFKKIKAGELIVIDFGLIYNKNVRTDITRTVVLGQPLTKQKKVYQIVKKAQSLAVKAIKPGVKVSAVDAVARGYIGKKGFNKFFIHTTGHGIGKKTHQAPKISRKNNYRFKKGQVITVEPGIYIKGWGGVRIEDMFVVSKNKANGLTRAKKRLKA